MQGMHFPVTVHVPGTLAANITVYWKALFDCILQHVSAVGSNANNGILTVGISTDTDSILAAGDIGDSGAPAEFDRDNWATTNPTGRINKGETVVFTLDYDGSSGTATQNFTMVATFSEG